MADTLVHTLAQTSLDSVGLFGPYWSDKDTGVIVFLDSGADLNFRRTTDGGASWGSATEILAGTMMAFACWYDKETPGDTGVLLHIAYLNDATDNAHYIQLNVATGGTGTQRDVNTSITVDGSTITNGVSITKTVSGNIIYALETETEIECRKSTDFFVSSNTVINDVYETATEKDYVLLFPASTADDNDACALFWDNSADEVSIKTFDDSAGTWTETSIGTSIIAHDAFFPWDAAVRHSDGNLILAVHSAHDTAGDDLLVFDVPTDVSAPTATAKTNIFTNQSESGGAAVIINQQTDDIYVAYIKGDPAWLATTIIVFHISTDGGGNWATAGEQSYSEDAADDNRIVHGGRSVGDDGGRIQFCFFDDDDNNIYINLTNDIEITAAAGGSTLSISVADCVEQNTILV